MSPEFNIVREHTQMQQNAVHHWDVTATQSAWQPSSVCWLTKYRDASNRSEQTRSSYLRHWLQ